MSGPTRGSPPAPPRAPRPPESSRIAACSAVDSRRFPPATSALPSLIRAGASGSSSGTSPRVAGGFPIGGAKEAAGMAGLSARLDHLHLLSEAPERLAGFYRDAMGMTPERLGRDLWLCAAPERRLLIGRGRPGTLGFGAFRCESADGWAALRARLERRGVALAPAQTPLFEPDAFAVADPDGNSLLFGWSRPPTGDPAAGAAPGARLQHLVVGSDEPEKLVRYYADVVGLPVSDKGLRDDAITACWLRTDP